MGFNFPNTPNVGDQYAPAGGQVVYNWNGAAWVTGIGGATGAFAAGPAACASASAQVTVNGSDVVNQSVGQCTP